MWFTIPSVSDIMASTTPIISSMLTSIWFIVFFALAISVAVLAALFVKRKIGGGLKAVLGGGRRRGRGRRGRR